jgi:Zn finger protein HypA/HybF involved in hydrogenase expression
MKKLLVILLLGGVSFVTSSFVTPQGVGLKLQVAGAVTTCPACGYVYTYYNTKSEVFTCPSCGCRWKRMKGDDVIIVAPPSDNDAKTPSNP